MSKESQDVLKTKESDFDEPVDIKHLGNNKESGKEKKSNVVTPVTLEVMVKEKSEDTDNLRKPVQILTASLLEEEPTSERVKQEIPTSEGLEKEMCEPLSEVKLEKQDTLSWTDGQEESFWIKKQASEEEDEKKRKSKPTEVETDCSQRDDQNQTDDQDESLAFENHATDEEEVDSPEEESTDLDVQTKTSSLDLIETLAAKKLAFVDKEKEKNPTSKLQPEGKRKLEPFVITQSIFKVLTLIILMYEVIFWRKEKSKPDPAKFGKNFKYRRKLKSDLQM